MKKLYNSKGPRRVHPSPPSPSPPLLSSLPTALLALASTLSPQEQEVLSYLLDPEKLKENQPKNKNKKKKDKIDNNNNYNHAPDLRCSCFGCYKSFWARWDASPNRHVIHLILDAFEETLESKEASRKKKKRGLKSEKVDFDEVLAKETSAHEEKVDDDGHDDGYGHVGNDDGGGDDDDGYDGDDGDGDEEEEDDGEEKSSVRRFVSWVFGMNN